MKDITLHGDGTQSLLEILKNKGIYISADCGGLGMCGKCKVRYISKPTVPTDSDKNVMSSERLDLGWRLACLSFPKGDFTVKIPEEDEEIKVELDLSDFPGLKKKVIKKKRTVAVDIGTTTIAAALVDDGSGEILRTGSVVNHQRSFGADVISRIHAANSGQGGLLKESVEKDLKSLVMSIGGSYEEDNLVISANTTMSHLLQGFSCEGLGTSPYKAVELSLQSYKNITVLPGISAFVGGDIVSGICWSGMDNKKNINAFIDLGTNGEMAIGNKDKMLVASTAAGPAFEGGNISCGTASVPGAISSVKIRGSKVLVDIIDDAEPIGICGTGVLETVSELLENGIIDKNGLLKDEFFDTGFKINGQIVFTQNDIRQVQMAKSAIRAGIETLVQKYECKLEDIDTLYIAGGFGKHIDVHKAVIIGMIPSILEKKAISIGNSSLKGAVAYITDKNFGDRMSDFVKKAEEVQLSEEKIFSDLYIDNMYFK